MTGRRLDNAATLGTFLVNCFRCLKMAQRAFSFFVIQQERTYINEEQRETLKSFFKEGMTRVGSPIIIRAASATGLDTSVIENWIGNYKRSLNASSEPRPSKAKAHIRELSPYNLFGRDILKNKVAAALRAHGQVQDLSPEIRDHQIKMHLKKLKLEVSKLEDLGVESPA
ncbi:uncharacterized protein LOC113636439 isoform X1 [Tachysurus ichikawai]